MSSNKEGTISSWKDLRNVVKKLPIPEAVYMRESELELDKRGHQVFGICPYHSDMRVGNFAIGGPHNGFKCFACGESGDLINLIMTLDEVSFKEALLIIAVEQGILTKEDAEKFQEESRPTKIQVAINLQMENTSNPYIELDEEQIDNRHAVYSLLSQGDAIVNDYADVMGLQKGKRLSEEHYRQLSEERGLTDEQIEEAGFFTMKQGYSHLAVLYLRLFEEYGHFPNVLNVPGFYRLTNGLTINHVKRLDGSIVEYSDLGIEDQHYWFIDTIDALGIPIRNEEGYIVAIQLRPDDSTYGGKYIWLSSTHATGRGKKSHGLSAGAQQDFMVPDSWNSSHLFITEGKFKSMAITDQLRSASISLQGVNTFRGIGERINRLSDSHVQDVKKVIIAFDADLAFNSAVMKAVVNMSEKELAEYEVSVAIWDYFYGKGIDDYFLNEAPIDSMTQISVEDLKHVMQVLDDRFPQITGSSMEEREQVKEEREEIFFYWLSIKYPDLRLHPSRRILQDTVTN